MGALKSGHFWFRYKFLVVQSKSDILRLGRKHKLVGCFLDQVPNWENGPVQWHCSRSNLVTLEQVIENMNGALCTDTNVLE